MGFESEKNKDELHSEEDIRTKKYNYQRDIIKN